MPSIPDSLALEVRSANLLLHCIINQTTCTRVKASADDKVAGKVMLKEGNLQEHSCGCLKH